MHDSTTILLTSFFRDAARAELMRFIAFDHPDDNLLAGHQTDSELRWH